jgi:membrane protease YdiL (CAAX protease family)
MNDGTLTGHSRARSAIRVSAASAGMILFALCAHQSGLWSAIAAGGLIMTAAAIGVSQKSEVKRQRRGAGPMKHFGLGRFSARIWAFTLGGAALGAGVGFWHRSGLDLPLVASTSPSPFVLVACLIGAAEEILYRGWLLGTVRRFGWPAAVIVAALAHAGYKTALFAWPAAPTGIDLLNLFALTAMAGIVLGALRAASGSVWPAVAAHAAFDFVVYRGVAEAPWWVWG